MESYPVPNLKRLSTELLLAAPCALMFAQSSLPEFEVVRPKDPGGHENLGYSADESTALSFAIERKPADHIGLEPEKLSGFWERRWIFQDRFEIQATTGRPAEFRLEAV
jgi:hypothetical protein